MPAGNGAPFPAGQGGGFYAELGGGLGAPDFPLVDLAQVALGVLSGFHPFLPPPGQLPGHGSHGAAALAGAFGTAEQDHIGLPPVVEVQPYQSLHLAAAQRFAQGGLRFLAQHGHIRIVEAGQVDFGGFFFRGHSGGGGPGAFQQPCAGPVLQGAFGGLHAGQPQAAGQGPRVGVTGAQNLQRYPHGIAVCLGQMGQHDLGHRQGVAFVFCQSVGHTPNLPTLKSDPIIAVWLQSVKRKPQNCPKRIVIFWAMRFLHSTHKNFTI